MPTRVYLLRHAETANPLVFHGAESDVGLSERGQRQAEAIALHFAAKSPHVVVSSNMLRARATALPIARACGLSLQIEPDLHERRVGGLSGTPTGDPESGWSETARRWASGETGYTTDGAESFDAIRGRVLAAWQRVTQEHAGQTVVMVAHGIVCKVLLLSLLRGYSVADWPRLGPIPNVGVSELVEMDGVWQAVALNEQPLAIHATPESRLY
jgi:probable phosphoglycerate mutase